MLKLSLLEKITINGSVMMLSALMMALWSLVALEREQLSKSRQLVPFMALTLRLKLKNSHLNQLKINPSSAWVSATTLKRTCLQLEPQPAIMDSICTTRELPLSTTSEALTWLFRILRLFYTLVIEEPVSERKFSGSILRISLFQPLLTHLSTLLLFQTSKERSTFLRELTVSKDSTAACGQAQLSTLRRPVADMETLLDSLKLTIRSWLLVPSATITLTVKRKELQEDSIS